jgi:hypothetical protein
VITNKSSTGTDSGVETLTNKTLTSPAITNKSSTGTDSGVETLQNKTFDSTNVFPTSLAQARFGGTGTDGALAISSGTTTIDCANAAVVVKNYTSIAITGTGKLAFSNPHANGTTIILKSQGAVTLTSSTAPMLDVSAMGAAGGASISFADSAGHNGNIGTVGKAIFHQTGAGAGSDGSTGAGGAAGVAGTLVLPWAATYVNKYPWIFVGGGGGSGGVSSTSGSTSTSGAGGNGGGCLILECAGAFNFTTASGISVKGANGAAGTHSGASYHSGGGGGGGGGFALILYNTLTANSGTITVSGGTGGNANASTTTVNGGGGGGSLSNAGNAGTAAADGAQSGGNGGAGASLVLANVEFA